MMKRARDILSEANRSKNKAELMKDEIDRSRNALLGEQMNLRKKSVRLKKQVARMTVMHDGRKSACYSKEKKLNMMLTPKSNGGVQLFNWRRERYGVQSNSYRRSV